MAMDYSVSTDSESKMKYLNR